MIVNNSLYNDNTKNQDAEFQIQYRADNTDIFENNIVMPARKILDLRVYQRLGAAAELEPLLLEARLCGGELDHLL